MLPKVHLWSKLARIEFPGIDLIRGHVVETPQSICGEYKDDIPFRAAITEHHRSLPQSHSKDVKNRQSRILVKNAARIQRPAIMDGHGRSGISPFSARDSFVDDQVPPLPNPKAVPHIWKYNEIKPLLLGNIFT
jgi:hypothetical protein